MKLKATITSICLTCVFLSSCCLAKTQSVNIPSQETQRLSISNLNLSGTAFFSAYMSKDVNQRRLAEMYLIGVIDSSEGVSWCSYNVASPDALQEQIYIGFKKETSDALSRRASDIIVNILSKKLPCKDKK